MLKIELGNNIRGAFCIILSYHSTFSGLAHDRGVLPLFFFFFFIIFLNAQK